MPYSACNVSSGRFSNLTDDMISFGMNTPGWYCINNVNISLLGQRTSPQRSYLRVKAIPCVNATVITNASIADNTTCASPEEVAYVVANSYISIATMNTFFDQDDFSEVPLKHEIKLSNYNIK